MEGRRESELQAPIIRFGKGGRTSFAPGTRLGAYEVLGPLGAGGMGEVYRARDTSLSREVALKVLPAHVAGDPDRLARFKREAQLLAALNHPRIAAIHGLEQSGSTPFLVLELVPGEDLAERLKRGPLSLEEALPLASQLAEALEEAHAHGIVHRDLKPANLKLTPGGMVKVLDFGLAKALSSEGREPEDLSHSPTMTRATESGMILGTAAYMSPEQARGKTVDARTDVWAFGCVVYEMLTGRKAFAGETATDVLAAIVTKEPDWGLLPPATPVSVRRLLRRCLTKDPWLRLHHMADARIELAEAPSEVDTSARAAEARLRPRWPTHVAWALSVILGGTLALAYLRAPAQPLRSTWSSILAPEKASLAYFAGPVAVSHDGSTLAFVATTTAGQDMVWVRPLDTLAARAVLGTEGASYPFWSGDDKAIGFFAGGKLKSVDAAGGPVLTICDAPGPRGGTWNQDGVILFATVWSGIQSVPSSGGSPTRITTPNAARGELSHRWPYFLPDGTHFAFLAANFVTGSKETAAIYLGSLDAPVPKLLLLARSNAAFGSGHILFVRDRTLMAQAFDEKRLEVRGQPFPVAAQVQFDELTWRGVFACSRSGVLAYQGGNTGGNSRLVFFDRTGKEARTIGALADLNNHRVSPDGKRVAVGVFDTSVANYNLWIYDLLRDKDIRLTFGSSRNSFPVWAPDGSRVIFSSNRSGPWDMFERRSDGTGSEEVLLRSDANKYPSDWSADGRFIIFSSTAGVSRTEEWILPRFGDGRPYPFIRGDFSAGEGRFSPDGRFLAYSSDESGRAEVYVTPFPQGSSKWQVSVAGGSSPRWRRDGREIYYMAADGELTAVDVDPRGSVFQVGAVRTLFRLLLKTGASRQDLSPTSGQIGYDAAPDGSWFLVNSPPPGNPPPLTLVTHWADDLQRR